MISVLYLKSSVLAVLYVLTWILQSCMNIIRIMLPTLDSIILV